MKKSELLIVANMWFIGSILSNDKNCKLLMLVVGTIFSVLAVVGALLEKE